MTRIETESSLSRRVVRLAEVFVWVTASALGGVLTVFLMVGNAVVMALGSMAGPTGPGAFITMLFITIPASLIYAFLVRRAQIIKAILGAVIFSLPIVWSCYFWNDGPKGQDSGERVRVVRQVANVTAGVAVCASAFFSMLAHVGWATCYIEKLKKGETVQFRPRGKSISGKLESGQLCTVVPANCDDLKVGDIVLCQVNGHQCIDVIRAKRGDRFQIGNDRGRSPGWIGANRIYGKCIRVE